MRLYKIVIMNKYDFPNKFDITLSVASGIEKPLKSELARLGITDAVCNNGAVTFCGDGYTLAKCNVNLRTADRVYVKTGEFACDTFDDLFDGTFNIEWERFIPSDGEVYVNGKCVKSKLFSVSDCQRIVKKAIASRICSKNGINRLPENGNRYEVDFYIHKDICCLKLNSSGAGLHKRGYRDLVGIAPIKETLASALLLMSDFYYKRPFADPFCGSGTIAIEAAHIALNIAPGINRKFAFNGWSNFDKSFYQTAVEEAKDNQKTERKLDFFASDIDAKAVKLAKRHAERAGVGNKINFSVCDAGNFKTEFDCGTIVTNPPYGTRVYDKAEAEECYKKLGKFKKENSGWSVFAITSSTNFEKKFGLKADRERKMYNSEKECRYYFYYGAKGAR